jgi:hypothetical protein
MERKLSREMEFIGHLCGWDLASLVTQASALRVRKPVGPAIVDHILRRVWILQCVPAIQIVARAVPVMLIYIITKKSEITTEIKSYMRLEAIGITLLSQQLIAYPVYYSVSPTKGVCFVLTNQLLLPIQGSAQVLDTNSVHGPVPGFRGRGLLRSMLIISV